MKQNNLFILHTQNNIILGAGIALDKYADANNDLVLFAEFAVSEQYLKNLQSVFRKVVILRQNFMPEETEYFSQLRVIRSYFKIFLDSELSSIGYDQVFMAQEREVDSLILGHIRSINKNVVCNNVEENVCFSPNDYIKDPQTFRRVSYTLKQRCSKAVKDAIHWCLFGGKYLCEPHYFYGMASFYSSHYTMFPKLIRPEIANTNAIEISAKEIQMAVNAIYGNIDSKIPSASKYYMIFFDLIERYKDRDKVERVLCDLINSSTSPNAIILCKYHPREVDRFKSMTGERFVELPKIIPAEKILCDLIGNDVTVVGNITTSLVIAAKLGYKVQSLAYLNGNRSNSLQETYEKMGINIIKGNIK